MSFAKRFGIVAAMEEIEEQEQEQATAAAAAETSAEAGETTAEDDVLDIPVAEDTVETAAAEVDAAESEVEQADIAIGEAEADVTALDNIADKIEASEETGGLDAASAEIVEVAVEHLYQRLGVSKRAKGMVAIESFGADSSRKKATSISAENIKETAQKVWDGILAMLAKAKEFVVNFFKAVFTANGRLKERATKLKTAIASLGGEPSATSIENAGFAPALAVGDSVDYSKINAFLSHGGYYKAELDKYSDLVKNNEELGTAVEDFKKANDYTFSPELITKIGFKTTTEFGEAGEGLAKYSLPDLPAIGGKTVVATCSAAAVSGEQALKLIPQFGVEINEVADTSEVKTAPTLKLEEAGAVLDYILKICDTTASLEATVKSINDSTDKIIKSVKHARNNDIANTAENLQDKTKRGDLAEGDVKQAIEDGKTTWNSSKELIKVIRAQNNFVTKLLSAPVRLNFKAAQASVEYVGQSLNLYGKGEAKEPEAAAA